jgi:hypothetical protein
MIIGALAPMSPDARSAASASWAASGRPLAIAAVITWVLTASIGVYMLRTWVARGGLHRQRTTGVGVPPVLVFGHARTWYRPFGFVAPAPDWENRRSSGSLGPWQKS